MPLEIGEFVGSLDCGTTWVFFSRCLLVVDPLFPFSSVRFIIFNKYADIIAQHQLEFPQYYPHPGCANYVSFAFLDTFLNIGP